MKATLIILLLIVAFTAQAKDSLVQGGRSKDGRYEIRLVEETHGDAPYSFAIVKVHSKRQLARLRDVGGYDSYQNAQSDVHASWGASGKFVAITDRDSRHSTTVYILGVSDESIKRLNVQDYVQNALGRVDATQTDTVCESTLSQWNSDELHVIVDFRVSPSVDSAVRYECEAVLKCDALDPVARLVKVTKPEVVMQSEF